MKMILALLALVASVGCVNGYYASYKEANPYWAGEFPTMGASLHETLAGLHGPRNGDHSLIVTKLDVLALRGDQFETLSKQQIEAALADGSETYAIVATQFCRSKMGADVLHGEKVSWFLLRSGELASYDAYLFTDDMCTVYNEFAPGGRRAMDLEQGVIAHRDAHFPKSMVHVGEVYRKGLAYASRGRAEEARVMLTRGDESLDIANREKRFVDHVQSGRHNNGTSGREIDRLRERLVLALAAVESVQPSSRADDSAGALH